MGWGTYIVHGNSMIWIWLETSKNPRWPGAFAILFNFWPDSQTVHFFLPYPSRTVVSNKSEPNAKERTVMIILFWVGFGLWPALRFGHGTFSCIAVVSASGKGVCHQRLWSEVDWTFLSFWVLEKHVRPLHVGWAPGLQNEKRRGTLLNMFENFLFSYVLFEECIFAMFGYWAWHFLVHSCCISFREGGLSSRPLHVGSASLIAKGGRTWGAG